MHEGLTVIYLYLLWMPGTVNHSSALYTLDQQDQAIVGNQCQRRISTQHSLSASESTMAFLMTASVFPTTFPNPARIFSSSTFIS